MTSKFSSTDKEILLKIARQAIEKTLRGEKLQPIRLDEFPGILNKSGACFVTLSRAGQLRGCVGSIVPEKALILDVQDRAISAAFADPRFPRLTLSELEDLEIEVSLLTRAIPLPYESPDDLVKKLRVGIDGVIMKKGVQRATFLPQVWEKLPDPELFLSRLCLKMGLLSDAWRKEKLEIEIYEVEKISDQGIRKK
jgi:AmmeMemoRadiSam system protein A